MGKTAYFCHLATLPIFLIDVVPQLMCLITPFCPLATLAAGLPISALLHKRLSESSLLRVVQFTRSRFQNEKAKETNPIRSYSQVDPFELAVQKRDKIHSQT